jgi:hypothetical protein
MVVIIEQHENARDMNCQLITVLSNVIEIMFFSS